MSDEPESAFRHVYEETRKRIWDHYKVPESAFGHAEAMRGGHAGRGW